MKYVNHMRVDNRGNINGVANKQDIEKKNPSQRNTRQMISREHVRERSATHNMSFLRGIQRRSLIGMGTLKQRQHHRFNGRRVTVCIWIGGVGDMENIECLRNNMDETRRDCMRTNAVKLNIGSSIS